MPAVKVRLKPARVRVTIPLFPSRRNRSILKNGYPFVETDEHLCYGDGKIVAGAIAIPRSRHQSTLRYPLTGIIGAEANVRVLRELARHGGELSSPSLVLRAGLAQSSVREALIVLVETGVVEALGSGRTQLYRLRSDHPLAPALARLFETEEERFDAVLRSIRSVAQRLGEAVAAVWAYGSVARGEDIWTSDLDIAIVASSNSRGHVETAVRERLTKSEEKLGFTASVVVIDQRDVQRLSATGDAWWTSLVEDSITILGERPEELAKRHPDPERRRRHVAK